MPVDTPWRASIETVNAVPSDAWLSRTIIGSSSLSIMRVVHREADQAARVGRHEVDVLGRDELGGEHEVALVLAIFVVDEDHHLAGADVFQRALDAFDRGSCGPRLRQLLDVLRQDIDLEVDAIADRELAERRHVARVRDDRDRERLGIDRIDRER